MASEFRNEHEILDAVVEGEDTFRGFFSEDDDKEGNAVAEFLNRQKFLDRQIEAEKTMRGNTSAGEGRVIVVTSDTSSGREVEEVEGAGTLYDAGGYVSVTKG